MLYLTDLIESLIIMVGIDSQHTAYSNYNCSQMLENLYIKQFLRVFVNLLAFKYTGRVL